MSEKLLAGLVAGFAIAPLCAVCVLGPAAIVSGFTGVAAWFGGFDVFVTVGLVLLAGLAAYGFVRKRAEQRTPAEPTREPG